MSWNRNLMFYIECFEVPRICRNVFDSLAPSLAPNWSFYSKINLELSRKNDQKTLHNIDHWGRYYSHDYLASDSKHALNQMMKEYGKMSANMKGSVTITVG